VTLQDWVMVNVCPNIYDKALAGIFGGIPTSEALNGEMVQHNP